MLNHTLILRALLIDLVDQSTLRPDVIVGLMRWFNPNGEHYVHRVTEWQEFLCCGTGAEDAGPLLVRAKVAVRYGPYYSLSGDVCNVAAVHQIAMIFWKEEFEVAGDWDAYAQRLATSGVPDLNHPCVGKLAKWVHNLLGEAPSWDEIEGTSGSGATADHRNAQTRWFFDRPPLGIPCDFFRYNARDTAPDLGTDVVLTARAACVPKNRKSPRFVASEPSAAMYAQLGVMKAIDKKLQAYRVQIPIRDADIHRNFLRRSCRKAATLDLSDASDYISMDLANYVLPQSWADLCNACRSQGVRLPDGRFVRLATYAPMGNGFCFRLLSVICAGILATCSNRIWSDFGDDMICLRSDAPAVMMGLEAAGLVLNKSKSGLYGDFVETCGLDLYRGYDITPLKLKRVLCFNDVYADIGAAARAADRNLYTVGALLCEGAAHLPSRYNHRFQRREVRCPVWVNANRRVKVDGYPGMTRWYKNRGENYRQDVSTLSRTHQGYSWLPDFVVEAWRGGSRDPAVSELLRSSLRADAESFEDLDVLASREASTPEEGG